MANSTSHIAQIAASQAGKEVTANGLFDAASPSMLYGRHAETCSGLSWGYYGGNISLSGIVTAISNGVLTLTASATNYIEANSTTGAVTSNTSGFTSNFIQLYTAVTGTSTVTSYTDKRTSGTGGGGAAGGRVQIVAYAASVTLDCALYDIFEIGPLTGNIAITMVNAVNGQKIEVGLEQDGTGGRTITWVSDIGYSTDLTEDNTASAMGADQTDYYGFRYHLATTTFRMLACSRGY